MCGEIGVETLANIIQGLFQLPCDPLKAQRQVWMSEDTLSGATNEDIAAAVKLLTERVNRKAAIALAEQDSQQHGE